MAFNFKPSSVTTTASAFGFGASTAAPAFGAAPTSTGFGGIGFGASSAAPAFGTTATTSGFSFGLSSAPAFGTTTSSTMPSFGGFSTGMPNASAAPFGTQTPGFGLATNSTQFPGFGTTASSAPTLFGTTTTTANMFNLKPAASTAFGGGTGLFASQPVQNQQPVNAASAHAANLCTAVSMPLLFGDERDTVIAKWNQLQAFWGTGRGYYNSQGHYVDFSPDNPFSFFKAVGYNILPTTRNEDGMIALTIDRKMSEVCDNQQAIADTLQRIITNNQQNALVCIEGIRPLLDDKTEVIIYVQQRANTGVVSRVTASDLFSHINTMTVKQALTSQLAVSSAIPKCGMSSEQLKVYLDNPPAGIDGRIWEQAKLDNPESSRMIPVPIVGFTELHQRLKHQEQQANLHQQRLDLIAGDIATLQRSQSDIVAKTEQYKRNQLTLGHRILKVLVKQELCRKQGYAIQADEEQLRTRLEAIYAELSAPMQFKGRLNELMSQIRMQNQLGVTSRPDGGYQMDKTVQQEIKQHLQRQQEGLSHLISIIKDDVQNLDLIEQTLAESDKLKR